MATINDKRFSWAGMDESLLECQTPSEADMCNTEDVPAKNNPRDRRSSWGDLDSLLLGGPIEPASKQPSLESIGEEDGSVKVTLSKANSKRSLGGLRGSHNKKAELRRKIDKDRNSAKKE